MYLPIWGAKSEGHGGGHFFTHRCDVGDVCTLRKLQTYSRKGAGEVLFRAGCRSAVSYWSLWCVCRFGLPCMRPEVNEYEWRN